MEKIATSFCSFETLRKRYTYVDKTDMLWRLVSDNEDRMFFISRPRRFGKSLMLDTLKCIFEGKRELFKGLKIDKKRYDWKKYPVVMFNMADVTASSVDELKVGLLDTVDEQVRKFGLADVARQPNPGKYLGNFFKALAAAKGEFVVLVDEYDVPLQGFLKDRSAIRSVRRLMHDFYVQLKNNSGSIRFMMMTGVTKNEWILPNHLTDLDWSPWNKCLLNDFLSADERVHFDKRMVLAMRRALGVGDVESLVRLSVRLRDPLLENDPRIVVAEVYRYFMTLPFAFSLTAEDEVRRQFQFVMEMLGAKVAAEEGSARGYADAIIETKDFVWVFEFKFNKSAKAAIRQIREKGYAAAYKGDRRPVTLVGVNFRTAKRNIDEPLFAAL